MASVDLASRASAVGQAKGYEQAYAYLYKRRHRMNYQFYRRKRLPTGSDITEAACKIVFTQRLKRSGTWWYEINSNQMLALRGAKYNGTFDQVFARHQQLLRKA